LLAFLQRPWISGFLTSIESYVCVFSCLLQWRAANVLAEEEIKGMLNLLIRFDAKVLTGFFGYHRFVCLLLFFSNAVKSYMFSRKKSLSKECSICREDLMRRTLPDSFDAIDPYVCLFSFIMQWRAICSRERRVYQRNVQSAERIWCEGHYWILCMP
jgi:hypothetical protein